MESCQTCKFWLHDEDIRGVLCGEEGKSYPSIGGYCRFNAPQAVGYFPQMASSNWCGEYQRKPEQKPEK